mmetsp:Transcript_13459/g.38211  ORF Transcript_13459/g.38211 Transcript_13459/m.38211 type:complete len:1071 (+) Transcript_13459:123-3335(+)
MAAASPAVEATATRLLDFSGEYDVLLLDSTVDAFFGSKSNEERMAAEAVLKRLQEHPEAWTRVDAILERSQSQQTKFFALQILESVIKYRWGALPVEQREGIRNYVSNLIIKLSTDERVFRAEKVFINKLNLILVQILKHEWPSKWTSFIPDIVAASKTSETLCENSMVILKLLSEEVFDYSRGELTQAKIKELKNSLNNEFRLIHELCLFVLNASQRGDLIRATLACLHAYLSWIPLGYIFESNLLDTLLKTFPQPPLRNLSLQCLAEVGSLKLGPEYFPHLVNMYHVVMNHLVQILPPGTSIANAYENGSDDEQAFVQNLALFLTGFFKEHIPLLETQENQMQLIGGLDYLIQISYVDDNEVFKTCLDYWNYFVPDVYSTTMDPAGQFSFQQNPAAHRKSLYAKTLSDLRLLMISRMAKPEEVIVVEDENGNIVRETMKDNDVLMQYRVMRETLVYLSHLDHENTENIMLEKLRLQLSGKEWSWNTLSTLCWAIGSISGSMVEEQENRFLVTVIRDLLNLCEVMRGKDNKAVIASNIMYVVGQYPRFLRAHWKFLKTVVNKLFEFMHETHPGVQDMACDTFLKICNKCRRKFVILNVGETEPFIVELLNGLTTTIQDLEAHQIHTFYEAVAITIGAGADSDPRREEYLSRLMAPPNTTWQQIIQQASANTEILKQPEVVRNVQNILQTNVSVCQALGQPYVSQLMLIYVDMLNIYKMYSELISASIAAGGPHASKTSMVKLMRTVKKVTLRLIETFVEKSEDPQGVATQFVPPMLDPILGDYARNIPDAREPEVLSVFAAIINKLGTLMEPHIPRIFEAVFECTLQMITRNFEDYPDHRLKFFSLLRAITNHCFSCLYAMTPTQLKLVIDSIIWAFRHTERNVAETGLNLLLEMLQNFQRSEFATQFHQTYYMQLVQEIFAVMTDTFHKPGFKIHARIMHHLFEIVQTNDVIVAPLWDVASLGPTAFPDNASYVRDRLVNLLSTSFPNLTPAQVHACVAGMFDLKDHSAFKNHLRDFLVQTKQFASQDNADLYAEEAAAKAAAERERLAQAVPGIVPPNERHDEMTDA